MDRPRAHRRFLWTLLVACACTPSVATGCGSDLDSPAHPAAARREMALEAHGIHFGTVVNAVDDLGLDPTGAKAVNDRLNSAIASDKLIEFPPGAYKLSGGLTVRDKTNWGLRGLGDKVSDVTFTLPGGTSTRVFNVRGGKNVLLENFTVDQGSKSHDAIAETTFVVEDGLEIWDFEIAGFNPAGGGSNFYVYITDPDGVGNIVRFRRTGPADMVRTERGGSARLMLVGRTGSFEHRGTLNLVDWWVENYSCGPYASKHPGNVRVEGGLFGTNVDTAIRISGEGSWAKKVTVIFDEDNLDPNNTVSNGWQGGSALRLESGKLGFSGVLVEDLDIIMRSHPADDLVGNAAIFNHGNNGSATIRNTRIESDFKSAIVGEYPGGGYSHKVPPKPHWMHMDNVDITGQTSDFGIVIDERDNSKLTNSCIELPNGNGIKFDELDGAVKNSTIHVGGKAVATANGADISPRSFQTSGHCEPADPEPHWVMGIDPRAPGGQPVNPPDAGHADSGGPDAGEVVDATRPPDTTSMPDAPGQDTAQPPAADTGGVAPDTGSDGKSNTVRAAGDSGCSAAGRSGSPLGMWWCLVVLGVVVGPRMSSKRS